jgi:hypothetical protein
MNRRHHPFHRPQPGFVANRLPGLGQGAKVTAGGGVPPREPVMKTLFALGVWCLLFVLCWPLAILALVAWPFVWLLSLPFRLVGITFSALFAFLRALFMLPARLLGGGRGAVTA